MLDSLHHMCALENEKNVFQKLFIPDLTNLEVNILLGNSNNKFSTTRHSLFEFYSQPHFLLTNLSITECPVTNPFLTGRPGKTQDSLYIHFFNMNFSQAVYYLAWFYKLDVDQDKEYEHLFIDIFSF